MPIFVIQTKQIINHSIKKLRIMKATKRFQTSMIVTYRLSNTIKCVSFDTLEDAKDLVEAEKELHPRSKKVNRCVWDSIEKMFFYCGGRLLP